VVLLHAAAGRGSVAIEEGAEIFGTLAFLAAALVFALHVGARRGGRAVRATVSLRARYAVLLALALAMGLFFSYLVLPALFNLVDGRGIPHNWFAASMATILVAACWVAAHSDAPAAWGRRLFAPLMLLGGLHLALSLDHGANHLFTEWSFGDRQAVMAGRDLLFGSGLLAGVVLLWSRSEHRGLRRTQSVMLPPDHANTS
jgi:hypothetical protein